MNATATTLDTLCINTIRGLSIDGVQAANSGHPGLPLGAAPMAYALWSRHLKFDPKDPKWFDRDRFILSAGHGSMLLYSLLHLAGYDLPIEALKNFRQLESKTPGHPENVMTPGVEMATGPLGQGVATAVGFAMAEAFLAGTYNRPGHAVVDHYTYAICSDGDLMEGVSNEAASLAGHLKLGKLIFLYDDNGITIDGKTDLAFTESVELRYRALGWHVQRVDGMDVDAVDQAIRAAKAETEQPSLILCKTVIGFGSPNKAGTSKVHGAPLGPEELDLTKDALGIPREPKFLVPNEVKEAFAKLAEKGAKKHADWQESLKAYEAADQEAAKAFRAALVGEFGNAWIEALPSIDEKIATRASSGKVLNSIASHLPTLIGGSADLAESNNTHLKGYADFQPGSYQGRNIAFGVREHAMAAAVNGMTLHGGLKAYGASFLQFTDYCRAALRLAALMECPSIFVFTHDSIGLGEDGPTHQPVEHLAALRAIPNFNLIRPCDGNETAAAWKVALQSHETPTLLALTRQGVPVLSPGDVRNHPLEKGAYVLEEATGGTPKVVLVGTGSEVQICVEARKALEAEGIPTRVVSMPSWHLFEKQSETYRRQVLPKGIPTVSVEAASTFGWARYAQAHIGLDRFGLSAPADQVYAYFGITAEKTVEAAKGLLP